MEGTCSKKVQLGKGSFLKVRGGVITMIGSFHIGEVDENRWAVSAVYDVAVSLWLLRVNIVVAPPAYERIILKGRMKTDSLEFVLRFFPAGVVDSIVGNVERGGLLMPCGDVADAFAAHKRDPGSVVRYIRPTIGK